MRSGDRNLLALVSRGAGAPFDRCHMLLPKERNKHPSPALFTLATFRSVFLVLLPETLTVARLAEQFPAFTKHADGS